MNESLLDTDTLSYYMKGDETVVKNAERYLTENSLQYFTISEITYLEIRAGLEYKEARKQIQLFENLTNHLKILKLTKISLDISANIYGRLKRSGMIIGTPDLLIAGIALEHDLTLITNNDKHFQSITGLKVDNWKE